MITSENVKSFFKKYFVDGLNGMALGLFSTLIIGLIIKQIGSFIGGEIGSFIINIGVVATVATPAAIGVGTAYALKSPTFIILSSAITGFIGGNGGAFLSEKLVVDGAVLLTGPGDPLSAFIAVVFGIEIGKLISGKTKVDIILTPFVTIISGSVIGAYIGMPISKGMIYLGELINIATQLQPFFMGIIISVVMGIALTLPISSAALGIILGLSGLPAGAATVGCATQMVGFAVASYKENKIEGLVAQGIGTSMLQISNIVKKPIIWLPPIIASAILGPVSTCVFKMENIAAGAGMGTSGFVGQITTWQTMIGSRSATELFIQILLLHFILPAVLTFTISEVMRKKEYIKEGDMLLN